MGLQELYKMDEDAWREENIRLLEEGKVNEIDATNIAVCLVEMGISEDREFESQLRNILTHFLCIGFSEDRRNYKHWKVEIVEFRSELETFFERKSYVNKYPKVITKVYGRARRVAVNKYPNTLFPKENPYTLENIKDNDYYGEIK